MYKNQVELVGFIGAEPEPKQTTNGKPYTRFSLATKTSWLKGTERQERTEWHSIVVWGRLAEYVEHFKKGAHILVEGEIRSREYDGDKGHVKTYEVVASRILNLRPGQRNNTPEDEPAPAPDPEAE